MYSYLERNRLILIYLPLGLYWLCLFIATTLPGTQVPDVGISDKFSHFFAYMILAILLSLTLMFQQKFTFLSERPFVFTFLVIVTYSIIDEVHQMLIPGRFFELADIAADITGGIIGILLVKLIVRR